MASSTGTGVKMNYNFGVASGITYPLGSNGVVLVNGSGNNYYFGEEGTLETNLRESIASIDVDGSPAELKVEKLYDGDLKEVWDYSYGNGQWDKASLDITITFKEAVLLSGIDLYWHSGGKQGPTTYEYSIDYQEEEGQDPVELMGKEIVTAVADNLLNIHK